MEHPVSPKAGMKTWWDHVVVSVGEKKRDNWEGG